MLVSVSLGDLDLISFRIETLEAEVNILRIIEDTANRLPAGKPKRLVINEVFFAAPEPPDEATATPEVPGQYGILFFDLHCESKVAES